MGVHLIEVHRNVPGAGRRLASLLHLGPGVLEPDLEWKRIAY